MSGHYNGLTLSLGALSIAITFWVSLKIGVLDSEGHPLELALRSPKYGIWLLLEIVKSNIAVVKLILTGKPIAGIQHFDTTGLDDLGRVIYANSVTLTPGTLTIDITDDYLVVHALDQQSLKDMEDGSMYFRVVRLMGETDHDVAVTDGVRGKNDQ